MRSVTRNSGLRDVASRHRYRHDEASVIFPLFSICPNDGMPRVSTPTHGNDEHPSTHPSIHPYAHPSIQKELTCWCCCCSDSGGMFYVSCWFSLVLLKDRSFEFSKIDSSQSVTASLRRSLPSSVSQSAPSSQSVVFEFVISHDGTACSLPTVSGNAGAC